MLVLRSSLAAKPLMDDTSKPSLNMRAVLLLVTPTNTWKRLPSKAPGCKPTDAELSVAAWLKMPYNRVSPVPGLIIAIS